MRRVKIDIEILIDTVIAYFDACQDYIDVLHDWSFDTREEKDANINMAENAKDSIFGELFAIKSVLCFTKEQWDRLFVIGKTIRKWREKTDYMSYLPCKMKEQIYDYIFGKEDRDQYLLLNKKEVEFI